jgi:hypothetical protein
LGLGVVPLPSSLALVELTIEVVKELVDFVEKVLGRRRDLSKGIHGTRNRESMTLIPIVSSTLEDGAAITSTPTQSSNDRNNPAQSNRMRGRKHSRGLGTEKQS